MSASGRRRPQSVGTSDRGAVAVEAALIIPLLLLLTLGVVEWALVMRDNNSVNAVVRDAGRTASTQNPTTPWVYRGITFPNVPDFAQKAADAAEQSAATLPKNSVQELWVFKPYQTGSGATTRVYQYPEGNSASSPFASCNSNCIKYRWNEVAPPAKSQFLYISGSWVTTSGTGLVVTCQPTTSGDSPTGSVGIYVKVRHDFISSGVLGRTLDLSDSAVFRFEPQPFSTCQG